MQHELIIIVGGGPVGITAAITLARMGKSVTVLDTLDGKNVTDARVLALSYASISEFYELGINLSSVGTAIKKVHISHNGLGINIIDAKNVNIEYLGYTVKYSDVVSKLYQELAKYPNINLINAKVSQVIPSKNYATVVYNTQYNIEELITAELVILAEGGKIKPRGINYTNYNYQQTAIITKIKPSNDHDCLAYERFEKDGSLVLLPHGKEYVLVWALDTNKTHGIDNNMLLQMLNNLPFMKRLGSYIITNEITSYPLKLQVAKNNNLDRVVLIGNSSQTVHPVSAQGLNLGLRDVRDLCEILSFEYDIQRAIQNYNKLRKLDIKFVSGFTHFLAKFLEIQNPIVNHLRGMGIIGFSNCKMLQDKLTNSLIFGI